MSQRSLRKDIINVGSANMIAYVSQFLLPIVVARALTADDFAGYRMVWLVVGTLLAFATLHIPASLSYFLPRVKRYEDKASYIISAVLILTFMGGLSALVVNPWYPLLPLEWVSITDQAWFYPVFIFLWVIATLVDMLPVGDGRPGWQAKAIVTLALTRVFLVSAAAWVSGTLEAVLYVLIFFVVLKISLLSFYILKYHNCRQAFSSKTISQQVAYSWTFGLADGLFTMRLQLEMWIVAAEFSAREFAAFSLGSVASRIFGLVRRSVSHVTFPNISELEAKQDRVGIAELNRKATSSVGFVLLPLAVFLWFFAEQIITIFYTGKYVETAMVMRVYLFAVLPQILGGSNLLRVSGLGRNSLMINIWMLPIVFIVSYFGIQSFGLAGGAIGSVATTFLSHYLEIKKGANHLQISVFSLFDFPGLIKLLMASIFAAVVAQQSVEMMGVSSLIFQVMLGGIILGLIYLMVATLFRIIPGPILRPVKQKFFPR